MKELTSLREQLVNKNQELQVGGTRFLWQYVPQLQKSIFGLALDRTGSLWLKPWSRLNDSEVVQLS